MGQIHKFKVTGDIPSKKNSYRVNLNPGILTYIKESTEKLTLKALSKFARLRPPKSFYEWEAKAIKQLVSQTTGNLYMGQVEIRFIIYFSKKARAGGDIDNKVTSLLDAIVKAGLINDDSYNCLQTFSARGIYRKNQGGAEFTIKNITKD